MSEDFNRLKSIGAQKIHEATHISRAHVQALLHESFEDMNSIQFLGFISILEREYSLDLSELKNQGKEYFDNHTPSVQEPRTVKVFVSPRKKRGLTLIYIAFGVAIFLVFTFLTIDPSKSKAPAVDNSTIESVKSDILEVQNDKNLSLLEGNLSSNKESNKTELLGSDIQKKPEVANEIISFKITPDHEVWLGYIDLVTHEKFQKTLTDEFVLDPSRDWLLAFGHGHISIEINGIIKKFKNPKNIRFSYINSELKEIDFTEFKSLNRGSGW